MQTSAEHLSGEDWVARRAGAEVVYCLATLQLQTANSAQRCGTLFGAPAVAPDSLSAVCKHATEMGHWHCSLLPFLLMQRFLLWTAGQIWSSSGIPPRTCPAPRPQSPSAPATIPGGSAQSIWPAAAACTSGRLRCISEPGDPKAVPYARARSRAPAVPCADSALTLQPSGIRQAAMASSGQRT